jgi:toxin YhaV
MTDFTINGWRVYLHPLFLSQYTAMMDDVRAAQTRFPADWKTKRCTKLLAATLKMAFEEIPKNPADARFRLGSTLGDSYKHWFRGKYVGQYRLFFRFSASEKIIVLAWVNDEDTKRAYGKQTDAYYTFQKMLKNGSPPDDWKTLLTEANLLSKHDIPKS